MNFINLTPHDINVYDVSQFINLVNVKDNIWTADGVEGKSLLTIPEIGISARINTVTKQINSIDGIPMYSTQYGDINDLPDDIRGSDILICSLPTVINANASGHPLAKQMCSPFQVVRLSTNTSTVLGCTGFTF